MKRKHVTALLTIPVVLLGAVIFGRFLFDFTQKPVSKPSPSSSPAATPPDTVTQSASPSATPQTEAKTEIVTISDNGISPQRLEIKKGTKVVFKNAGKKNHWPASDPHPSHSIYREFDPGTAIRPGKEWGFVFDKTGSFKYHDHMTPTIRAVVVVTM